MAESASPHRCDIFAVAGRCGITLPPANRVPATWRPKECFAREVLRRIGRKHGEGHLELVLRLIVESAGNAAALRGDVIWTVSELILSGVVEVDGALFDAFDRIDLDRLRRWAVMVKGAESASSTMLAALKFQLAAPDLLFPPEADEARVARETKEARKAARKRRQARRKRLVAGAGQDEAKPLEEAA